MNPDSMIARLLGRTARSRPPARRERAAELAELAEFPEMNPGPVLRLDLDGTVLLANAAARRVFRNDGLLGTCWLDLCPGMTRDLWDRALESREPVNHEAVVHDSWLVFTHARRHGTDLLFVYGTDITARRQAEQALADQARELAEMALFPEMNPGSVCRLDREGTILLANSAARRLFEDDELVGKCWLDVCPQMTRERWEQALASTGNLTHETQVGDRYIMFTHTPGADEREIFVYGADLTELRLAERALRQSEKMATLGTLAAGVAHELNNPAAAAQRAAEQLSEAFDRLQEAQIRLGQLRLDDTALERISRLDETTRQRAGQHSDLNALERSDRESAVESWLEDREIEDAWEIAPSLVALGYDSTGLDELTERFGGDHVGPVIVWLARSYPIYSLAEEIRQGTGRLAEIVSALKAYSYVGQGPLHAVDINEGLRNTLVILRNKLKRGITVEQELAADLPAVQGYGGELNQVWTNLIDNAADAVGGEGRIRLRTYRDTGRVVAEIEDDGPGIPDAIQPRIFDPFFTTKAPGQGTGLGLNTSYNIVVQKHGGTIDVFSRPGCTRFTVKLPIEPPRREGGDANGVDATDV